MTPNGEWDDLRERLENAAWRLGHHADDIDDPTYQSHLRSKAEGVRLALDYMRSYTCLVPNGRSGQ